MSGAPKPGFALWKKFTIAAIVCTLATAASVATAALLEVKDIAQEFAVKKNHLKIKGIDKADVGGPQTILLLGSDVRYAQKKADKHAYGQSDTIILVRLNKDADATTVMSIPRDLKVDIPGHGISKINAAYSIGGPSLTLKTVKQLTGLKINHIINIHFGAFSRAVNYLGCIYTDVDRRYFNDNSGPGPGYATINIKPGYQKLCGHQALDYVRYRHEDTDLVRAARQQDFLRQAKQQVGTSKLINNRKQLAHIFGHYTQTDISGTKQVLSLVLLAAFSAQHPLHEVHFPFDSLGTATETYVTTTPALLAPAIKQFMQGKASGGSRGKLKETAADKKAAKHRSKHEKKKNPVVAPGLEDATTEGENQAVLISTDPSNRRKKLPFPVYVPKYRTIGAQYLQVPGVVPRVYSIRDRAGKRHRAYRLVVKTSNLGEYYGVQATDWRKPPILASPSETRSVGGRKLDLYFDGNRLRLVAWKTSHAVYWVSNTLLLSLTNKQMLGIARSLHRL